MPNKTGGQNISTAKDLQQDLAAAGSEASVTSESSHEIETKSGFGLLLGGTMNHYQTFLAQKNQHHLQRWNEEAYAEKYTMTTVKHGGDSVMLWGAASVPRHWKGVTCGWIQTCILGENGCLRRSLGSIRPSNRTTKRIPKSTEAWFQKASCKIGFWPSWSPT